MDNNLDIQQLFIAEESHKDGGTHFHALLSAKAGFDSQNERLFDIKGHHPNIQKLKDWTKAIQYISKEDKDVLMKVYFNTPTDFCKRKRDMDQWTIYMESMGKESPFPFLLPKDDISDLYCNEFDEIDRNLIIEPKIEEKKCNFIIKGPPDCGKTKWV